MRTREGPFHGDRRHDGAGKSNNVPDGSLVQEPGPRNAGQAREKVPAEAAPGQSQGRQIRFDKAPVVCGLDEFQPRRDNLDE